MAQVKKFQTPAGPIDGTAATTPAGNPAETKKKHGKWIRNGIEYEMDDEKMKDLEKYIMSLDPSIQPYVAEEFKRLQNGENVTIDTMLNQRSGVDDYKILNDRQEKRLQNGKEKEGFFSALFNTKTHKFNKATYELGQWDPSKKITTAKPEEVKKTKLTKLNSGFDYELTDANVQRYKDLPNEDEMKYLISVLNYLAGTNRNNIDASGFEGISDLESWYKTKKINKEWTNKLISDITSGRQVSGEYKDFLDTIGLTQRFGNNPELQQQELVSEFEKQKAKDWADSEYASVWSGNKDRDAYFKYNTDGTFTFKGNLPSGLTGSSGYYFNDEFVDENPMYEYLLGKINYDNKWYSEKDLLDPESLLYRTLAAKDYFNMNKRGEYGNANKIMKASWKGQENLIPAWGEGTEDYLGDFYGKRFLYENLNWNMPHTKLRVQSGLDENGAPIYIEKDINDKLVIRRGVDLTNTKFLPDGRRPWSWSITDAYGDTINDIDGVSIKDRNLNYDNFIGLYDGSTVIDDQKIPEPRRRISGDVNSDYYNRYAETNPLGFVAYKTKDGKTVHVFIPSNFGGEEGVVYKDMPINVYNALSDKTFWDALADNPDLARRFNRRIREGKGKIEWEEIGDIIPRIKENDVLYYDQGLAEAILNYFVNNPKRIKSPESFKKGGIIKAQGGTAVRNLEYTDSKKALNKATALNEKYRNPYAPEMVRENGNWDLWKAIDNSDRLEMMGLVADGLGMIAGMWPVYGDLANVGLSTIGANILYGIADRRKVKAGAMPPWTVGKNLAMSIGADALSLIPAAGELANMTQWGSRLKNFALKSEPFAKGLMTIFTTIGAVGAADSFKKLMNGEDLNMDDFKELIYGTMSALGLIRSTNRAISDSRLARNSAPDPKQPTRSTKFKAEDGTEQPVTLDEGQISILTNLRGRDKKAAKEELAKMLRNNGVPAEEINRIMNNSQTLKELGLIWETPKIGSAHYSEVKPELTHGTGYYFLHPIQRTRDLQGRTVEQLFQGANDDPRAAARWINANLGYSKLNDLKNAGTDRLSYDVEGNVTDRHYRFDDGSGNVDNSGYGKASYTKRPASQSEPEVEVTTRIEPEIEVEPIVETRAPEISVEPEIIPVSVLSAPEWNAKFNQYSKLFGTKYNKNSARAQFDQRINSLKNDPDFTRFADTDPQTVKIWLDQQVDQAAKAIRVPKKQLRTEVKNILGYKQGGRVLKGQNGIGQWARDVWGAIKNGINKVGSPDSLNTIDSISRFLIGDAYNKKSAENQIKAVKDSLNVSKHDTPIEYYTPNYINAGNAERQFAQSQFQYRPSPTNDPIVAEAFKKQGYDQGNLSLANATRQDAGQHSNNLLRNVEEHRNYANIRTEANNQWRDKVAAGINAIAGISDVRDKATAESFNQFIYERQQQRDVDMAAVNEFAKSKADYDNQMFIQNEFDKAYKTQFTKDNSYNPNNPEHVKWVSDKKSELQRTYQNRQFDILKSGLSDSQKRLYDRMYSAKSGGKLRPVDEQVTINREKAKDQIKANTFKSVNRNWENNQKAARRALDKMSDRVKSLIMKILS